MWALFKLGVVSFALPNASLGKCYDEREREREFS